MIGKTTNQEAAISREGSGVQNRECDPFPAGRLPLLDPGIVKKLAKRNWRPFG